ncbi:hypothetical protein VNO80_10114 [Phaseolus coccineus]|uniref:Uncharacterized protein n=1 Tax=Phaseolus coccineus TaxID=3886 RepID=A0AAN9NCU3_PHACN
MQKGSTILKTGYAPAGIIGEHELSFDIFVNRVMKQNGGKTHKNLLCRFLVGMYTWTFLLQKALERLGFFVGGVPLL